MPAYILGQVTVHDPVEYNKYMAGFMEAFAPFGGRVLVATDECRKCLKEIGRGREPSCLNFPLMAQAKSWYESPKYQAIVKHRFKAAKSSLILVNGFEVPKG